MKEFKNMNKRTIWQPLQNTFTKFYFYMHLQFHNPVQHSTNLLTLPQLQRSSGNESCTNKEDILFLKMLKPKQIFIHGKGRIKL